MMFLLEASTNRNRMSRMGSSEYPFNLNYQLEGIAVGLLHRYRCERLTEHQIHLCGSLRKVPFFVKYTSRTDK